MPSLASVCLGQIPPYNNAFQVVDAGAANMRAIDSLYSSVRFPGVYFEIVNTLEKYGFVLELSNGSISTQYYLTNGGSQYLLPRVHEPILMWTGSEDEYCCTGLFLVEYDEYTGGPGSALVKSNVAVPYRDVFFFSLNTTGGAWNLPFRFNLSDDDWNLVELESYEEPKRVKALNLSLWNISLTSENTVCDYYSNIIRYQRYAAALNRVQVRTYRGAWASWEYEYSRENSPIFNTNLWLGFPQQYTNFAGYDYDGGGEIDISEWANFRNRLDPLDDLVNCGENRDPTSEESSPVTTTPVDWGSETKSLYLQGLTGLIGDPVSAPEVTLAEFPRTERATIPDRQTLYNQIKARSDAAMATGQYAALREIFAPLASDVSLPVWSLPSSTVVVGGTQTTFDLSFLSIDLNALLNDDIWSWVFRFAYMLIELGLILVTAWYVKNLLWSSLIGLPEDGSKSS